MLGILGHGMYYRHCFVAPGRGRHRGAPRRILLEVPRREGVGVAALTRVQRSCLGVARDRAICRVVSRIAFGDHRYGQRAILVSDDVHDAWSTRSTFSPNRTDSS